MKGGTHMSTPPYSQRNDILQRYIAGLELILLVGITAYAVLFAIMLNI